MSLIIEDSDLEEGRLPFYLSSKLQQPLDWVWGIFRYKLISFLDPRRFDPTASKIKQLASRIFIGLFSFLTVYFAGTHLFFSALLLGTSARIFRCIGVALQKGKYTHVRGGAERTLQKGEAKMMIWSIRGQRGGMHYTKGGTVYWRSRFEEIANKIRFESADVVVLQGIEDGLLAEALIREFKREYAHFFIHLNGGNFIMAKGAVHKFSHTDFTDKDRPLDHGFEIFELKSDPGDLLPSARIVAAHFPRREESKEMRKGKIDQIVRSLAKEPFPLPTFFMGNGDQGKLFSEYMHPSYRGQEPTHTDQLLLRWGFPSVESEGENGTISLFKRHLSDGRQLPVMERVRLLDCHLVKAFDEEYNPQTALSDNHAVVTAVSGLTPPSFKEEDE